MKRVNKWELVSAVQYSTVQYSTVQWSEVNWWAVRRLLRFGLWELLLLEAGSWGTGNVRELRVREISAVESRYQATTCEDTAEWEYLLCSVVNCRLCESVIALYLLVSTSCVHKCSKIQLPIQISSIVTHTFDNINKTHHQSPKFTHMCLPRVPWKRYHFVSTAEDVK
jgi:hypothetical protein